MQSLTGGGAEARNPPNAAYLPQTSLAAWTLTASEHPIRDKETGAGGASGGHRVEEDEEQEQQEERQQQGQQERAH